MEPRDHLAIWVNAHWNDWRSANARLDDLRDVHWHQPKGAPQPILHAYLSCADLLCGELLHVCDAASAPHRIRVCVLRSHNTPSAHAELARRSVPVIAQAG